MENLIKGQYRIYNDITELRKRHDVSSQVVRDIIKGKKITFSKANTKINRIVDELKLDTTEVKYLKEKLPLNFEILCSKIKSELEKILPPSPNEDKKSKEIVKKMPTPDDPKFSGKATESPAVRQINESKSMEKVEKLPTTDVPQSTESPARLDKGTSPVKGTNQNLKRRRMECMYCEGSHNLWNCEKFELLCITKRWNFVEKNPICIRCLKPYHTIDNCRSHFRCRICNKRDHYYMLHKSDQETESSALLDMGTSPVKGTNRNLKRRRTECMYCEGSHNLWNCEEFERLCITKRWNFVEKNPICVRCLKPYHTIDNCRRDLRCFICKSDHHHHMLHKSDHLIENGKMKGRLSLHVGLSFET